MRKNIYFSILTSILLSQVAFSSKAQWVQQPSLSQIDDLYSIEMVSKNIGYAGSSGKILKTINGGLTWEKLHYRAESLSDSAFMDYMLKQTIYFFNENEGYIGGKGILGSNDIIIKTIDGGQHWTIAYQGTSTNFIFINGIKKLFFVDKLTGYAVGSNSSFIKTVDGGKTWTRKAILDGNVNMVNLQFFDASTAIATAVNGLYKTSDKGVTWQPLKKNNFTEEISASHFFSPQVGLVAIRHSGDIYKTKDGGESWERTIHPEAYTSNQFFFTSNTTGYLVGRNAILKTTTSGDSWEHSAILPLKNLNGCFFSDVNTGWAVGEKGLIMKTVNAGGPSKPYIDFEKPASSFCEGINYTFINRSDPNYQFTWIINNKTVSNSYNLTTTFSSGTKYILKLVAFNGVLSDTAKLTFETPNSIFWEQPVTLKPLPDSICYGYRPQITVPNSVVGAKYELYINNILHNESRWGNGGDITFFPPNIQKTSTFKVIGIKMNSCTNVLSEFSRTVSILPIPNRNLKNVNKPFIVCSKKDTFFVKIANSEKTAQYQVGGNPKFYRGNGDTLLIPTTANENFTPNMDYSYSVRVKPVTARDCEPIILNYLLSVKLTDLQVSFTVSSNNIILGTPLRITNTSNADSYEWLVKDGNNIIRYTGASIEPLKFTTPGEKTIKLIGRKTYGCTDSTIVKVKAIPEAPSKILNSCWLTSSSLNHDNKGERSILDSYVDENGFIYTTGYYTGQSRGNYDVYLAKYTPEGTLLWNRETDIATKFSGFAGKGTFGTGIAVDDEGNIYLSGSYGTHELKFDEVLIRPLENNKSMNGFLFKFNSRGIAQWAIQGANNSSFTDVLINNNQEIYTMIHSGADNAIINFTDKKVNLNANGAILIKINKQGELILFKPFTEDRYNNNLITYYNPNASNVYPQALAGVSPRLEIDNADRLIIHGTFINFNSDNSSSQGNKFIFKIGSNNLTSSGHNQRFTGFIGIYDPNLESGWSGAFKTFHSPYEYMIGDPNRNIIFKNNYVYISGPILDLRTINIYEKNNFTNTSFLSKYDLKGNLIWNQNFTYTQITDIAISKTSDDLLLFGVLGSVPNFPSQEGFEQGTPVSKTTQFLASYDTNGNLKWLNSEPFDFSTSFAFRVATNTSLRTSNCDDLFIFKETGDGLNIRKSSLGQSCTSSKLSLLVSSVTICEGQSTQLTASGSTTGYSWTPVIGLSNSTIPNPTANPTKTTTYTVSALDENGCLIKRSLTVVVEKPLLPLTSFEFTASPQTTYINFQRPQHLSGATLTWDFGDGTYSTETNPSHKYATPGTYRVCLKAENKCNTVSVCQNVSTICEMASADFKFSVNDRTIRGTPVTNMPIETLWDFGNGHTSINNEYTYMEPGIYQVCLTITTPCGTKKVCKEVTIACNSNTVDFIYNTNNKSVMIGVNPSITSNNEYFVNFGDGSPITKSSSRIINYTYSNPGSYQICLTVKNRCGEANICKQITVTCNSASADFTYTISNRTLTLQPSIINNETNYKWEFGDGKSGTLSNQTYTYADGGLYQVCLIAKNGCNEVKNCKDVRIITVTGIEDDVLAQETKIYPNPAINFLRIDFGDIKLPNSIQLFNSIGGLVFTIDKKEVKINNKIDVSKLSQGMYILQIQSDKGYYTFKISINR